jgi:hypothetical protein
MRVYFSILEAPDNQFDLIRTFADDNGVPFTETVIKRYKKKVSAEQYIWDFQNRLRVGSYTAFDKKPYKVLAMYANYWVVCEAD